MGAPPHPGERTLPGFHAHAIVEATVGWPLQGRLDDIDRSLLRRPGYPEELIGCLLLLASEAGSFITGQTMYVEGGWLAGTSWTEPRPQIAVSPPSAYHAAPVT